MQGSDPWDSSMNVVVSAIVDPWVTTFFFVVALAMKIKGK